MRLKDVFEKYPWTMLLLIPLVPFSVWYVGWAVSSLFNWFVVPAFNINPIGILTGSGLYLTVRFAATFGIENKRDEEESTVENFLFLMLTPLFVVGIGWCIQYYI